MPEPDLEEVLTRLERIVGTFENEPDAAVRERVFELLDSVDAAHRRLVWAVGERIWSKDQALFQALLEDPITSLLFEMYGLVAPARRGAEPAPQTDRPSAFISLGDLEASVPQPLGWYPIAREGEVSEAKLLGREAEGIRVMALRAGGEVRVFEDRCPGTPMPLSTGALREGVILCPWHDCRFDGGSGQRLDRKAEGLVALPVAVRDEEVRVMVRARKPSAA